LILNYSAAFKTVLEIINGDKCVLKDYCQHLKQKTELAASTIQHSLRDINQLIVYFRLNFQKGEYINLNTEAINLVIKNLLKQYSKLERSETTTKQRDLDVSLFVKI